MKKPFEVLVWNPLTRRIDVSRPVVGEFTVDAIFAWMKDRKWNFQPGVYVAIRVEPGTREPQGEIDNILTFTVTERERVTIERVAAAT